MKTDSEKLLTRRNASNPGRIGEAVNSEQKAKAPSDFELVPGEGIHPFYLGMETDQIMEAAVGWKIISAEREFGSLRMEFERHGKVIDVNLLNTLHLYPGFHGDYRAYFISTYDARFADGRRLSRMKQEDILSRFNGDQELVLEDSIVHDGEIIWSSYESEDIVLLLNDDYRPCLSISRMPRLGWDEDD